MPNLRRVAAVALEAVAVVPALVLALEAELVVREPEPVQVVQVAPELLEQALELELLAPGRPQWVASQPAWLQPLPL